MGCGTVGSTTDVHGSRRWDSSTAGSPTDVQVGRRGTAAPPDRRPSCLRVGDVPSGRRSARWEEGQGRAGHHGLCLRLYTPSPWDAPRLTRHLKGDRALPSGASSNWQYSPGGGGYEQVGESCTRRGRRATVCMTTGRTRNTKAKRLFKS